MQKPAASPDAGWIAFDYKGIIYKVPSQGGRAIQTEKYRIIVARFGVMMAQ